MNLCLHSPVILHTQRGEKELDRIQAEALRIILGTNRSANIQAMHIQAKFEPIHLRRLISLSRYLCTVYSLSSAHPVNAMWWNWLDYKDKHSSRKLPLPPSPFESLQSNLLISPFLAMYSLNHRLTRGLLSSPTAPRLPTLPSPEGLHLSAHTATQQRLRNSVSVCSNRATAISLSSLPS
jgi:hypothetical protein